MCLETNKTKYTSYSHTLTTSVFTKYNEQNKKLFCHPLIVLYSCISCLSLKSNATQNVTKHTSTKNSSKKFKHQFSVDQFLQIWKHQITYHNNWQLILFKVARVGV